MDSLSPKKPSPPGSTSPHITKPSATTTSSSSTTRASPMLSRLSRPIASAIEDAQPHGKGVEIVLHSSIVTGRELKRALDDMFPGPEEYFVQLRRDRYRITLPQHSKDDIRRKMSR